MATSARSTPDGRPGGPLKDTRTQLFVGNLPYRVRWQDLKDLFRKAGTVLRADVSLGPDNRSRGYGTVLLASAEDAGRAVDMFNGYSWQTRILEVRADRLPPDFENPMGLSTMPGFAGAMSNSPMPVSSFAGTGQVHPLMGATMGGGNTPGMADDFDYTSFYMHEALGPGPNGGRNLFVGNDLKDLFRQAGTIIRADVALGQDGRSRGFGTVVFATDMDADRAVKMFNGYEYNGRQLKVHYDRFSQSSQPVTAPTSPLPSYSQQSGFGSHLNAPSHISMPVGYPFNMGAMSGPSSPYGGPSNGSMAQPHPQNHGLSVDRLAASLAASSLGTNAQSNSPETHSNAGSLSPGQQSGRQLHQNHSQKQNNQNHTQNQHYNHSHAQQQQQQQQHHHYHHAHHPGPIALPPPPSAHGFPMPLPHTLSPHAGSPLHHPMSPMHHPMMTPHGLPPITPSMPPFSFLPQPSPHAPASPGHHQMQHVHAYAANTPAMHAAHMLSTLSPGVTMSPGAFWGRPGGGAPNPFINPAVGAPVHGSPGGFFGVNMHPVSPGATAGGEDSGGGYFPPVEGGYFPPMASSRLANEIMREKASPEEGEVNTPGSGSSDATDMGTHFTRGSERRTSSSTGTSWHTPDEATKERAALEAVENEREASSSFLPDDESEGPNGFLGAEGHPVVRTNSMGASGKADRVPMVRGGSDPVQTFSSKDEKPFSERAWSGGLLGIAVSDK
ncbi:hypothetical protein HWV62_35318 [Athelia sp. TMB]|nr:hypothetical protein HWV62_35318 [Athelia sp. TMB]